MNTDHLDHWKDPWTEVPEELRAELEEQLSPELPIDVSAKKEPSKELDHSPLPWEAFAEKITVAEPERARVVIRAANGYRVTVEDNPSRWEQALKDFEFICQAVNSQ